MSDTNKPLILIVEDVESNYLYLNAVLTRIEAQIEWVKNGIEAVDFAKEHPETKLILMDLQMPEMNGYDATREIKKLHPEIPIIAQTAFAMSDDRTKALEAGCDDYLAKPIRSKDLLDTVNKYL
ncbi:MAG: response regulator [Prolixibacteraceae bacterium]|nr:response regulator [Prolixibacteraceae bacterium]MBN2648644.1 response regulator [Prolixibacteraceae bacterium]